MASVLFTFIETSRFTREVQRILTDDEYTKLQWRLIEFPDAGDIIPGSGGIRKIRFSAKGKGTRGGARVIYYLAVTREKIFMLDIYAKNEKTDLDAAQLKELSDIVKEWLKE
ncbi:MAG: type II toxin-antitoxin system RelE/ParE family toxin [Acidobacteria bacterium]|nr:type II toxin-antitoxin system RelE/ParE family toxin [Acidobacteriota bacterium]